MLYGYEWLFYSYPNNTRKENMESYINLDKCETCGYKEKGFDLENPIRLVDGIRLCYGCSKEFGISQELLRGQKLLNDFLNINWLNY